MGRNSSPEDHDQRVKVVADSEVKEVGVVEEGRAHYLTDSGWQGAAGTTTANGSVLPLMRSAGGTVAEVSDVPTVGTVTETNIHGHIYEFGGGGFATDGGGVPISVIQSGELPVVDTATVPGGNPVRKAADELADPFEGFPYGVPAEYAAGIDVTNGQVAVPAMNPAPGSTQTFEVARMQTSLYGTEPGGSQVQLAARLPPSDGGSFYPSGVRALDVFGVGGTIDAIESIGQPRTATSGTLFTGTAVSGTVERSGTLAVADVDGFTVGFQTDGTVVVNHEIRFTDGGDWYTDGSDTVPAAPGEDLVTTIDHKGYEYAPTLIESDGSGDVSATVEALGN